MWESEAKRLRLERKGPTWADVPSYWLQKSKADSGGESSFIVEGQYRVDGYNFKKVEAHLNESLLEGARERFCTCDDLFDGYRLEVQSIDRIENLQLWQSFRVEESWCAACEGEQQEVLQANERHLAHASGWLRSFEVKNGLGGTSDTRYLLHGTTYDDADAPTFAKIAKGGFQVKYGVNRNNLYGSGTCTWCPSTFVF